jgi:hypothetical protein
MFVYNLKNLNMKSEKLKNEEIGKSDQWIDYVDQIYIKRHVSKIKNGLNIEDELRFVIENDINDNEDSQFQIFGGKKRKKKGKSKEGNEIVDFKQLVMSDLYNDLLKTKKTTFLFKSRLDRDFFNFPLNIKTKEIDVITIGNDNIDLYYFKKGNGVKGTCNSDTTISEAIPNLLNIEKEAIHLVCGTPFSNINGHIVVFTTEDPIWKTNTNTNNIDVVFGGDICKKWGIGDKFDIIKKNAELSSSSNYDDIIGGLNQMFNLFSKDEKNNN